MTKRLTRDEARQRLEVRANGGRLSPAESAELDAALEHDPTLAEFERSIRQLDSRIAERLQDRWPKPAPAPLTPIMMTVTRSNRRRRTMTQLTQMTRFAMALLLLAGGLYFGLNRNPLPDATDIQPGTAAEIESTPSSENEASDDAPIQALGALIELTAGPNRLNTGQEPPPILLSGTDVEAVIVLDSTDFDAVEITGFGRVEVAQGEIAALSVTTDSAYLPRVVAQIENGQLTLGNVYAEDGLRPTLTYRLTLPTVTQLSVSGGATIAAGELSSEQLTIEASGGAVVEIGALETGPLTVIGRGGPTITISGPCTVDSMIESLSGGPTVDLSACN